MGLFRLHVFLFQYTVRITEHTEYQFPKEQTENRIADLTKIKAMRPRKSGYAIFPPKDAKIDKQMRLPTYCVHISYQTAVPSILPSGAELTEYYSIHSGIRIGRKRTQLLPILCIPIRE